jgi:hypothetical protein
MLFVSVAVPLAVCASRVQPYSDAAHDVAVARALGLGFTGAFRALDVVAAHAFLGLPMGTRALRAGLASACLCGVAGGLLFVLAKRLLATLAKAPVINPLVATLASVCASLSGAWIVESETAGSSILGVVLGLVPVVLASGPPSKWRWPLFAGALGLAVSYEPFVGLIALAGSGACAMGARTARPTSQPPPGSGARRRLPVALAFALGCCPFVGACAWLRLASSRLATNVWASPLGEGTHLGARTVIELLGSELGWLVAGLSLAGTVMALVRRRSRARAAGLLLMLLTSALAVTLGAPAGPWRFGGPALVFVGAAAVLAGVAVQSIVVAVAHARVPLAGASAAMVLVLALTFPVLTLDDALARSEARATSGTRAWDDAAFEALPAGTLLLVSDSGLHARVLAAEATGELRGDLSVLPSIDVGHASAQDELDGVPDLVPLLRDYVLYGEARERTLSSVAASRPLALGLVPAWEHALSRHVVPSGLFGIFHPEPRGASERLLAIDDEARATGALRDAIVSPGDAELAALTTRLLDARARSLSAIGEKDAAARVTDDSLALAMPGTRGARRARRLETSRFARATTSR